MYPQHPILEITNLNFCPVLTFSWLLLLPCPSSTLWSSLRVALVSLALTVLVSAQEWTRSWLPACPGWGPFITLESLFLPQSSCLNFSAVIKWLGQSPFADSNNTLQHLRVCHTLSKLIGIKPYEIGRSNIISVYRLGSLSFWVICFWKYIQKKSTWLRKHK